MDFTGNRTATSNVFSTFNPSFCVGRLRHDDAAAAPRASASTRRAPRSSRLTSPAASRTCRCGSRWPGRSTQSATRTGSWSTPPTRMRNRASVRALATRQSPRQRQRVELGTVAAIDVVEAEAEVAARHQAIVQADGAYRAAQVTLKQLMVANTSDPLWAATMEPVERPSQRRARSTCRRRCRRRSPIRTDLDIARKQLQSTDTSLKLLNEERKPGVDLTPTTAPTASAARRSCATRHARRPGHRDHSGRLPGCPAARLARSTIRRGRWASTSRCRSAGRPRTRPMRAVRWKSVRRSPHRSAPAAGRRRRDPVGRAVRNAEEQVQAAAGARQLAEKRLAGRTDRGATRGCRRRSSCCRRSATWRRRKPPSCVPGSTTARRWPTSNACRPLRNYGDPGTRGRTGGSSDPP